MRRGRGEAEKRGIFSSALRVLVSPALLFFLVAACDTGGGAGPEPSPFDEAAADPGAWHFVPVEGAVCRDGSPTGLGVRLQEGSDRLVLFLAGGSVCLGGTCGAPEPFGAAELEAAVGGGQGVFDDARAGNPLRGWDVVFVPNCTNDLHSGNRPDAPVTIDGTERPQQLVGRRNVERYLEVLAPYFAEYEQVLLYGISAGSFGALFNYAGVAEAFAPVPVTLLAESGPLVADAEVLTPAFQQTWRAAWDLNATLPPPSACPDCYGPAGGGLHHLYDYLARAYPQATFGLLTSGEDTAVRRFFNAGRPDCTDERPEACLSAAAFRAALYDQRAALPPAWGTYYAPGGEHVFAVEDATFYDTVVGGTPLTDWIAALVAGEAARVPRP